MGDEEATGMTEAVNEEPKKSLMDRVKDALDKLPNLEEQLRKLRNLDEKR